MKVKHIITERATVQGVKDNEELEYLKKAADLLVDTLDLEDHNIIVSFDPPYDLDKEQHGVTIGIGESPNKIFILIDKGLSTGEKIRVLAHELIHAKQIAKGELVILGLENGKIKGRWQGEEFKNVKYSKRNPWEVEAHRKEKELQRFIIDQLGNFTP